AAFGPRGVGPAADAPEIHLVRAHALLPQEIPDRERGLGGDLLHEALEARRHQRAPDPGPSAGDLLVRAQVLADRRAVKTLVEIVRDAPRPIERLDASVLGARA